MDEEILLKIGLTKNEIKVYLMLLKNEPLLAGRIAKLTYLNRSHIYDILKSLIEKGLVSFIIKANRKYFKSASPERLSAYIEEKEGKIKEEKQIIQNLIPELLKIYTTHKDKKIEAYIYEGKKGIMTIFEDILKSDVKEWLAIASSGKAPQQLPFYLPHFHKKRIKSKINLKVLINDDKEGKERGKELSKMTLTQVKYLPSKFITPISIYIYNNKTAFIIWNLPIALMIENKETTDSFRDHFEVLWKS
ncbi:MAG: helix-turn-helix domain-containing protein [Nanoarchaeota archaeon]|nr:helix-turn-helix domain-containing protein [Nanoarchaeota archaeon]